MRQPRFSLTIELDNDAFENQTGQEVARILCKAAESVADWPGHNTFTIGLRDVNGNRVGQMTSNPKV